VAAAPTALTAVAALMVAPTATPAAAVVVAATGATKKKCQKSTLSSRYHVERKENRI